jgi:hypothetical protein
MRKKAVVIGGALALWLATCGLTVGANGQRGGQPTVPQFLAAHQDFNHGGFSAEAERIIRGYRINPVRLNLRGKDPQLVGLGSYIVNTSGCNDCHTNPPYLAGGDPFLGEPEQINADAFLSGGTPFGPPGGLVSANLTPDASGRPAGLTLDEFKSALKTGVDPDDGHILQVMPWPVFGKKTDHELRAIYEYLRAIPSIE